MAEENFSNYSGTEIKEIKESKIKEKQEKTASRLAYSILITLIVLISVPIILLWSCDETDKLIDYIKYILPSVMTLAGLACGFYFSEKRYK